MGKIIKLKQPKRTKAPDFMAYVAWLHQLTNLAYTHNITIGVEHAEYISNCHTLGFSPAETLEKFETYIAE